MVFSPAMDLQGFQAHASRPMNPFGCHVQSLDRLVNCIQPIGQLRTNRLSLCISSQGSNGFTLIELLVVISIIWVLVLNDKFGTHRQDVLATAGLYWHFVDAVWLCVFTVIYLLPYLINAS